MSGTIVHRPSPQASEILRRDEREERDRQLVVTLRRLAFLASQAHDDEPTVAGRARWSRLVVRVDEQLRKLCNNRRAA